MDPLTTSSPTKRPSTSSTRFRLPIPTITLKKQHIYAFFVLLLIVATIVFPSVLNPFNPQSLLRITFLSPFQSTNQDDQSLEAKQKESDKSNATVCDYSNGEWVWDANYPSGLYNEKCQFLDPGFQCHNNGRMNQTFRHWRWQPHGCDLPRFNATDFLERSRNGRIVFAGDSIGRNQWESLICMLTKGVSNEASIYELSGMPITRHKGFFRIRFQEYNVTVEYYRAPFLVRSSRPPPGSPDQVRGAVKIDQLHWYSEKWVGGSILVFNAGHWWNDNKTIGGGMYFQQGQAINMTMHYMEAFRRSMKTWLSWAEQKLDPQRSHIFFRSYSPVHYRNGTWSTGGTCRNYMIPETNKTKLHGEPQFNQYISDAIEEMKAAKWKVNFLNITYLSELRSDGHPSIHREPIAPNPAIEDCSHWCLPGVPDTWNQILYAQLVAENFRTT